MTDFDRDDINDLRKQASINLRNLREAIGVNQDTFAKEMGVSRAALSYYENGSRTPDMDFINTVHIKTNCSLDYLLGWSTTMNESYLDFDYLLGLDESEAEILTELCRYWSFRNLICSDAFKDIFNSLLLGADSIVNGHSHAELILWKCLKAFEPLAGKMLNEEINYLLSSPEREQQYNERQARLTKELDELRADNEAALERLNTLRCSFMNNHESKSTPSDPFERFRLKMAEASYKKDISSPKEA